MSAAGSASSTPSAAADTGPGPAGPAPAGPPSGPAPASDVAEDGFAASWRMGVMRLARRLRQEREPGDLTLTQLAVLGTLECNGPSSLRRLAEDERVSAPTMSRIVNHLCEAGLVTRAADEADGRQVLIEVTPAACAMLDAVRLRRDLWLAERMRELDDDQRRALRAALPVIELLARR